MKTYLRLLIPFLLYPLFLALDKIYDLYKYLCISVSCWFGAATWLILTLTTLWTFILLCGVIIIWTGKEE
jgi:hypothetical protein